MQDSTRARPSTVRFRAGSDLVRRRVELVAANALLRQQFIAAERRLVSCGQFAEVAEGPVVGKRCFRLTFHELTGFAKLLEGPLRVQ